MNLVESPPGVLLRPPQDADAAAIAGLWRQRLDEFNVGPEHIDETLRFYWDQPEVDRARHQVLADVGGHTVGVASIWPDLADGRVTLWAYVAPEARLRGIGTAFVDWFVAVGLAQGARTAIAGVAGADTVGRRLLARAGFGEVRTFYKLQHDEPARVAVPVWPPGIKLDAGLCGEELWRTWADAHEVAFAEHWDERPASYRRFLRTWVEREDFDPTLVTFARAADGAIAGFASGMLSRDGDDVAGDVDELGVLPGYRGRGLGGALLRYCVRELVARGATRVTIGVDAQNATGALGLYERAGFRQVSADVVCRRAL